MEQRVLILDGAMGTMLRRYDTDARFTGEWERYRGCNDLLALIAPDILEDIHRQYLEAGADIVSTNSFNTNTISLADHNLADRVYDMARASAEVARRVADEFSTPERPRYVAGSMGPTNRTLSMSARVDEPAAREVTFGQMRDAFYMQAKGLIDGGADMLLIETVFDTLNAKAAISAVRSISPDIPVIISATVSDASGRLLSGQTIEAFAASVVHARPLALGLNCGFGARHILPYLRRMARVAATAVSVHPNAGLPNIDGGYDETPEMFAADVEEYFKEGLVNIVGGCCGTTPEHISAIAPLVEKYAPRMVPEAEDVCVLSGLEPLALTASNGFVNVGERTNVAGSAKFARLIREGNFDEALAIAKAQVEAGAQVVDVCMDDAMIDGVEAMRHFLNLMASEPDVARVPVMIDSSKWEVIEAGLQSAQGKSIVNSISLKEGEEVFLKHARTIMDYGAAAVVMLFDEKGQADTFERKTEVAGRAYRLLTEAGFPPADIIFDPNILAVATGIPEHDRYARAFIDATAWIKAKLPYAKVSGGVSNLSFAFRGNNAVRKAMHAVFLYHAIRAGMDMAIVNPQMVQLYDDIDPGMLALVEDLVLYRREDAADRLTDHARRMADGTSAEAAVAAVEGWRDAPCSERIAHALLSGDTSHIADDALEAYGELGSAVAVIDRMLMPAMERVGRLFGEGKMFLPQVVKSARVMKQAVAALEPFMTAGDEASSAASAYRIILATVKGDVHDIGKNIVGIVLACDGYRVVDLGVMVPPETIVDEAVRQGASAICLSGLITPSLDEMIHVAEEVERRGLKIPVVVGGATTSALHTAVKIAPVTLAPVAHTRDAADNASTLNALLGERGKEFVRELRERQQRMRDEYYASREGRADGVPMPPRIGAPLEIYAARTLLTPDIEDVAGLINWDFFFAGWGIPGKMPAVFSHPEKGDEARKLYEDAQDMLAAMAADRSIGLQGVLQTFRATADGDDVVLHGEGVEYRLPAKHVAGALRRPDGSASGGSDVTLFALTAGMGLEDLTRRYREAGDDYSAIMAKLLSDRLAEAFAEKALQGGCRIAIGYPAVPDHGLKRDIFDILKVESDTCMSLTGSNMIVPGESICGIRF